jgi:hypothetical protein
MIKLIDIKDLKPEDVLVALFNASIPPDLECMHPGRGLQAMTVAGARAEIEGRTEMGLDGLEFFEVAGRSIFVNLGGGSMAPGIYDRENGRNGAAQEAIDSVRAAQGDIDKFPAEII